jgi:hypothetical protein
MNRDHISRRTVLRGIGVTMALPWLESIPVWGAAAGKGEHPKRFAVLFMGNGISPDHWSAEGQGAAMKLSKTLAPLEPFKQKLNVINGLFNKRSTGQGIHPAQTGALLTGAPIQRGPFLKSGISMDQVLAKQLGEQTPQPSIVLACEQPMTGYHETNFSMAYSSHISWYNAESPVPNEVYPSLAFDTLFDNRGSMRNKSILDRVKEDAASLHAKISATDRTKLDEYMTGVREVEKRVEGMRVDKAKADASAAKLGNHALTMERPQNGLPEDLREHAQLMVDIIAMAFQTDKTRIASLLLARDLSNLYYPFLDVREGHHSASHSDTSEGYERIARFHVGSFAHLVKRLDEMPEGEGTVLDNSCLMFLSNLWSGTRHDNRRLPVVLAGGLAGTLETGRSLDYFSDGDENRKICSLYLSIMDRMGVTLETFGDADARLARV